MVELINRFRKSDAVGRSGGKQDYLRQRSFR